MPVNVGTLVIDLKANTAEFSDSMGKMSDETKAASATIVHDLKLIGEAGLGAAGSVMAASGQLSGAFTALSTAVTHYGAAMASANASSIGLANTYRAVRLALSPTLYTVATLAVAALAEETMELVYARGKLIEQQAVIAAQTGRGISDVERTAAITDVAGANSEVIAALQKKAGDRDLVAIAEQFAAIEDPVRRAALAVRIFGSDAQTALNTLNLSFVDAGKAVDDYGVTLDDVARTRISNFRRETQEFFDLFTDWSKEKVWFNNLKTDLEIIGADVNYWLGRTADWFDQITGQSLLIAKMKGEPEPPPAVGRGTTQTQIAREDMVAGENAAQRREQGTLEGLRKQREETIKNVENGLKELNNKQTKLTQDQLFNLAVATESEQAHKKRLDDQIKAAEDADAAQKRADAKARELAEWQARAGERLTATYQSLVERSLTDPIAAQLFRGRMDVTKREEGKTPKADELAGRAALANMALQQVVKEQLTQFGKDWEKGITEMVRQTDRYTQELMQNQLRKDEAVMAARRGMQEQFVSHDIAMAGINAGPGEEAETAQKILDIHLHDIDTRRVAYLTEEQITKLNTEQRKAYDDYYETLQRVAKERIATAMQEGGYYSEQLRSLQEQLETLNHIKETEQNAADIAASRAAIEDKILDVQIKQTLAMGGAMDGVRAFFIEMQKQAKSAADIIYETLNSTMDKLSDNLANLMTGQKANWSAMFKDIGHQMTQESTKALLTQGLGALGKAIPGLKGPLGGILGAAQKKDGQGQGTALWVQLAGAGPATPGGISGLPNLPGINENWGGEEAGTGLGGEAGATAAEGAASSGVTGFLGKLLAGLFGGGKAGGGEVSAGSAYLVGERGPELYTPGQQGNIHTAAETRGMMAGGGDTHITNIDARGSDIGVMGRIEQAQAMTRNQAVTTSVQTVRERNLRTPTFVHQY